MNIKQQIDEIIKKQLKEVSNDITPKEIYYKIGDAVQDLAYLINNEPELKKDYIALKNALKQFKNNLDRVYNKKWD